MMSNSLLIFLFVLLSLAAKILDNLNFGESFLDGNKLDAICTGFNYGRDLVITDNLTIFTKATEFKVGLELWCFLASYVVDTAFT